jgi:hypothetical protein
MFCQRHVIGYLLTIRRLANGRGEVVTGREFIMFGGEGIERKAVYTRLSATPNRAFLPLKV